MIPDASRRVRIVIPGDDPPMIAGSPQLERLRQVADVVLFDTRPEGDEQKVARAAEAEILLNSRGLVRWPGSVLRRLPRLKMIACCAVGFDCIDMPAARELGIVVCNVPGRTAGIIAEHALALLLATARRVAWTTAEMKQGRWPSEYLVSLAGKRLGVIGTGNIGCALIRLARAIGMEVVAWSFHPEQEKAEALGFRYVELAELLQTSDAVSLHLKLTDESRHLIDARALERMKPGALLINTARGAVVDQDALVAALQSGKLGGAGLDVFRTEPLPADDPLLTCPQVVLTPHAADQMPEGMEALCQGAVENVLAFLAGRPENVVG
ncbi:MAG: D-glycerate dehydrogenase [Pirellulaceae bacterium]|nr:D-glycerate dehydrogenase [Pirellulaceae bacterium]